MTEQARRGDERRRLLGTVLCACAAGLAWRSVTAPSFRTLSGDAGGVHLLTWSPDSKRLASGNYSNALCVWNVRAGRLERRLTSSSPRDRPISIAWSPDGNYIASGMRDGSLIVWDGHQDETDEPPLQTFMMPVVAPLQHIGQSAKGQTYNSVHGAAFSPGGALVSSGVTPGKVGFWTPLSWRKTRSLPRPGWRDDAPGWGVNEPGWHGASAGVIAFSPDGKTLAVAGERGVTLCDAQTGRTGGTFALREEAETLVFSPNGRRLAASSRRGGFIVWNLVTGQARTSPRPVNAYGVCWTKHSRALLVTDPFSITLYDAETGKPGRTLMRLSPQHPSAFASYLGVLLPRFFNPASTANKRMSAAAALSPDGTTLAYATGGEFTSVSDDQIYLLPFREER